jgi:thiol:disulfide interchange protein DsbD
MLKVKANFVLLVLFLGFISQGFAQVYEPVSWKFETTYTDDNKAELKFIATIEDGWHVYALNLPSDEGPIPTSFTLTPSDKYQVVGKVKQGKYKTDYDPNFDMDLNYFDKKATFTQTIDRKSVKDFNIEGYLTFMVCNDEMCLPPEDVEFKINLKGATPASPQPDPEENPAPAFGSAAISPLDMGGSDQDGVLIPVKWTFSVENETDSTANLVFEATIDEGWYVYSQFVDVMDGIGALKFNYEEATMYQLNGGTEELDSRIKFDSIFEVDVIHFTNKARFIQKIVKSSKVPFKVKGYLTYTACDNEKCTSPEDVEFSFDLLSGEGATIADSNSENETDASFWGILLLSFLGGFAALLTPCVFPMVPMTVSFFTKQSKTKSKGIRNALIYSLSIILVYLLLSVPFHVFESVSPDILNEISTNVYLNVFFFVIFIVFAISFFGAFEITLPASLINKADKASDVGGIIGIFFMAIVLVLVSFSCTGPLLGALLGSVLSSDGGASALTVGMLGFGIGLAFPFGLFAAFPSWLNSLPQSGGWLNSVKVVLGFLELALAFKFLSNADLVLQANLLSREVFLAIWIAIFLSMALYLFGAFQMPHDSKSSHLGVGRMLLAIFTLSFTLYLIPGLWGAPLKLISGFPPPSFYSESPTGIGGSTQSSIPNGADIPLGADPEHCPHGLNCFHDYETGLEYAKSVNKPILLDFTGWACVNCRKMEEQVWSDPRVLNILKNDVVLISLYVDERKKLEEDEQYISEVTGKKIRTVGNKWHEFQIKHFKNNSQPFYVFVGLDNLIPLHESAAYDSDTEKYINWLSRGLEAFEKKK